MRMKMRDLHEIQLSLFESDEDIIFYKNGKEIGRGVHTFLGQPEFDQISRKQTGAQNEQS